MPHDACLVPAGSARTFALADLAVRFRNDLASGVSLSLAPTYAGFEVELPPSSPPRVDIGIRSEERLEPSTGPPLKTAIHWTVYGSSRSAVFDFRHVPSSQVYCRAFLEPASGVGEIVFAEAIWREGGGARLDPDGRLLPFPLEQLLLLPVFALEGAIVVHAGGGILGDEAFVYAGHSGDGKSTLSGLLADEGLRLMSDERIVLRKRSGERFFAHGTPWSGTGNVAARLKAPLGTALLLKKSARHALSEADPSLVPELVSRSIVPYYFPDVASEILGLFDRLTREVPVRELHFAKAPGVRQVLSEHSLTSSAAGS